MAIGLSEIGARAKEILFNKVRVRRDVAEEATTPAPKTPAFVMVPEERDPWGRHFTLIRTPGRGNKKLRFK